MRTFQKFVEESVPYHSDSLIGKHLGPQWERKVRVYKDNHGKWECCGDFDTLLDAESTMRRIRHAGYEVRAVSFRDINR